MKRTYRNLLAIIAMYCMFLPAMAQPGTWAWMHGPQTGNSLGVFGVQGIPAATNVPHSLYECAHWTDLAGNFWLFGGGRNSGLDLYADLWKFDPTINQWTWMKGPQTANTGGVYGTQGVSSPGNYPGTRTFGSNSWVDNNGDLWLLGGYGYDEMGLPGYLTDLWKYEISTNQWTWMKGRKTGGTLPVLGTMGLSNPANFPPAMSESNCVWVDTSNNVWVFGGTDTLQGILDQVWRYNTFTNEWTWMKGNLVPGIPPTYGTLGVAAPSNSPGSRGTYTAWKDCLGGFWMFGGNSFQGATYGDVWKFVPDSLQWIWMGGSNIPNESSTFSSYCTPSTSSFPGALWENRAGWADNQGRLWSFGGVKSTSFFFSNQLWCFEPATQSFTFVKGSVANNPLNVYGNLGVGAPLNTPSGRGGYASFQDLQGNFWFFGGYQFGGPETMSDMWKFTVNPNCPPGVGTGGLTAAFTAPPVTGCSPVGVTFTNSSSNAGGYTWNFGDGGHSIATNPTHTFNNPGSYNVMLIAHDVCGAQADTAFVNIVVGPYFAIDLGPDDTICNSDSILLDAGNLGTAYLWSDSSTAQTLSVHASGTYWVEVINADGCIRRDSIVVTNASPMYSLGPDSSICAGASLILDAGYPGYSHLWSNGDQTQYTSISTAGSYWVQITPPTGCIIRDTIAVTLRPQPMISLGPDSIGCEGTTMLLDAGNNPGASFLWSTNAVSQSISISTSGLYWTQVTDSAGCQFRDSITVTVAPLPVADLSQDSTICEGDSLRLDAGNPGSTYLWSTGEVTQTITVTQAGSYSVQVSSPDGCIGFGNTVLSFVPDFAIALGPDTTFCKDRRWTLSTGQPSMSHLWSTGQQSASITASVSGTYSVQVSNPCFTHADSIRLVFASDTADLLIPNVFTPNGDGINDVLLVSGEHTQEQFTMQVHDRWGRRVFSSNDARMGWDGTLYGSACPEGIYFMWVRVLDCGGTFVRKQTSVTLIR